MPQRSFRPSARNASSWPSPEQIAETHRHPTSLSGFVRKPARRGAMAVKASYEDLLWMVSPQRYIWDVDEHSLIKRLGMPDEFDRSG